MGDSFRVVAIIAAFNEGDVISAVIGWLVENGIDVYLIDNHSRDDTVEQASQWLGRGLVGIETFPPGSGDSAVASEFRWSMILRRKVRLSRELPASWFMHHDADEIREPPWPGTSLKEAIRWVDGLGYNCIDFRVFNFPPVDEGFRQGLDPRAYFHFFEDGAEYDRLQLKCWKAGPRRISLAASGGHDVRFEGRRVFPIPFILRHYPVRTQAHGLRKVFEERKNRFVSRERARGWHIQYEAVQSRDHLFLRDPATLRPFDLEQARLEILARGGPFPNEQELPARAQPVEARVGEGDESQEHGV